MTGDGVVALTLDGSVSEGAEIAVAYRPQMAATDLRDPEGNEVAAFDVAAENATDTAPVALSGSVDRTSAVLTFDQALGMASPDAMAFRLTGTLAVVTSLDIAGATLTLTLQPPVQGGRDGDARIHRARAQPVAGRHRESCRRLRARARESNGHDATCRSGDGEWKRAADRVRPTARRGIDAGLGGVQRDGRSARQRR